MIRLTFVSTLAYNYFFPGQVKQAGGQTRIYNLARAFAKVPGYQVFCITGDFGQPDQIVKENVTLIKAPIDNPLALVQVIQTLISVKSDLILDFCASPRLGLYYLLKKILGSKYIFFTGSDNDVNGGYKTVENRVYDYFYRLGLKHADAIIAQVHLHYELLGRKWQLDSHLVLSPYLDIRPKKAVAKEIILWVGRAAFYKRPELFIALAAMYPREKFVMICNKSSYDKGFMTNIGKRISSVPNLEFHEYVAYPQMEHFYRQAKLLINTSDFEGFPNTFIEAAVCATPVLSLNSDPNNMFSVHGCGYQCNGNFDHLKENLTKMLGDKTLLMEQGKRIFDYAYQFHRIENAVDRMDTIFKEVLWEN